MSRFHGHVERRIFNAVLLVLGACGGPVETQPVRQPVSDPAPLPDAAVDAAAEAAADAPVSADVVAAAPGRVGDADALCDNHKQSPVDRSRAKQSAPPPEGSVVIENAAWDATKGVAVCTIIRERVKGTVVVMHQRHWCPQSGGTRPPPEQRKVQGEKLLIERAWIRADGTLAKSDLEWTASGMVNERIHNCGRRFEGLELPGTEGEEPGAQLAAMAELEAASVPAFDRLARELAAWGAPPELVERAQLAMRDEIRHARVMTALARRWGHTPRAIEVPVLPCRSLEAIAHENAIEGCVREAYGALVATYQAERAAPELRAAFGAIAVDERSHAALAEDVHAWILGRLDADASDAVRDARARAESELRASVMRSRACSELGLPGAREAVALCDAYFGEQ